MIHLRKRNPPGRIAREAHAKGFRPTRLLWQEVVKTVPCTQAQFSAAIQDKTQLTPKQERVRMRAEEILSECPAIYEDSFRIRCANSKLTIEDVYELYTKRFPDHHIGYKRFHQSVSQPLVTCDYVTAKRADSLLKEIVKYKQRKGVKR